LYQVNESTDPQNGGAAQPLETIELSGSGVAGRQYLLVLRAKHLTRRVRVHVFLDPGGAGSLYPSVAGGSILNPASARSALAVGAVDVMTSQVARYSSQGPTDDGRLKPDVTGPANTISWAQAAQGGRFDGTSAAAPHAAAFAALLKEMNPALRGFELRTRVMAAVAPQGPRRPNFSNGYGEIDGMAVVPASHPRMPEIAPSEGAVPVPAEFGGSIRRQTLTALRQLANDSRDGMRVRVVSGRDLYRIGDGLRLGLRATEDCACLLFVRDSRGEYSLVPGGEGGYFALRRGESRIVPDDNRATLAVDGPPGTDELLMVCAPRPLPIEPLFTKSLGAGLAVAMHSYEIIPGGQ
jgi:hypothetical protein